MPYIIPFAKHASICPRCSSGNLLIGTTHKSFLCGDCGRYFMWTDEFKKLIWDKTHGKCLYCAVPLLTIEESGLPRFAKATTRFTIDHFYPLAKGGKNLPDNLVPCCQRCNGYKKHSTPMEYMIYLRKRKPVHPPRLYQSNELTYLQYPDTITPAAGDGISHESDTVHTPSQEQDQDSAIGHA